MLGNVWCVLLLIRDTYIEYYLVPSYNWFIISRRNLWFIFGQGDVFNINTQKWENEK